VDFKFVKNKKKNENNTTRCKTPTVKDSADDKEIAYD